MPRERVEVQDHVQRPYRGMHWIREDEDPYQHAIGILTTEHGLVEVRLWVSHWRKVGWTQTLYMVAVVDGQEHTRWEKRTRSRAITKRGAAIVAGRWIRELAGGRP